MKRAEHDSQLNTGEYIDKGRTYPGYEDPALENLAIGRYIFGLTFIKEGDICLDAACGAGYGTELISRKASRVIGLEYDEQALKFARDHYQNNKIEFLKADLTKPFVLPSDYFDAVFTIETIEHITDHEAMLSEFKRVLKPGGLLIASTVEHHVYSEKGGIKNIHHIGELTKKELLDLISKYFKLEEIYGQIKFVKISISQRLTRATWIPFLKLMGVVDVFKLRYRVAQVFRLNKMVDNVNESFSSMKNTGMEKTDFTDKNEYYQLMVVARKS